MCLCFFGETSGALPLLSECWRIWALRGVAGKAGVLGGEHHPAAGTQLDFCTEQKGQHPEKNASMARCGGKGPFHLPGGQGWAQQKGVWSKPRPALALANGTQSPSVTAHPGWLLLSQCPGPPQTPGLLLHLGRKMNPTGGTNKEQVVGTSLVV